MRVRNFLPIFLSTYGGILGNLCEVDVSNQDPRWIGRNGGRAHTSECGRKRLYVRPSVCGRAQTHGIAHKWEQVARRRERFTRRRIGLCADGNVSCVDRNGLRTDACWSCADGSRKSKNFGRPYLTQNLSKLGV